MPGVRGDPVRSIYIMGELTSTIRPATPQDAEKIAAIYNYYVEKTTVTFEEKAISVATMTERLAAASTTYPWLVAESTSEVLAYAYASPWSNRSGYKASAETTIYVAQNHTQKGIGIALYGSLMERLRAQIFHCAIGVIAQPNPVSVSLHEKLGFRKIGVMPEIGKKFGNWISVGYWQLLL